MCVGGTIHSKRIRVCWWLTKFFLEQCTTAHQPWTSLLGPETLPTPSDSAPAICQLFSGALCCLKCKSRHWGRMGLLIKGILGFFVRPSHEFGNMFSFENKGKSLLEISAFRRCLLQWWTGSKELKCKYHLRLGFCFLFSFCCEARCHGHCSFLGEWCALICRAVSHCCICAGKWHRNQCSWISFRKRNTWARPVTTKEEKDMFLNTPEIGFYDRWSWI